MDISTASLISLTNTVSAAPSNAFAIFSFASPSRTSAFTFFFTKSFKTVKSPSLSLPPIINTIFLRPSRDLTIAPTFVPLESLIKLTPSISQTNSSLCSRPEKSLSTSLIASAEHPQINAAREAAIEFSRL